LVEAVGITASLFGRRPQTKAGTQRRENTHGNSVLYAARLSALTLAVGRRADYPGSRPKRIFGVSEREGGREMTTSTKAQQDSRPYRIFFHEVRADGSVYRRETQMCEAHADEFFISHPDAYGIGDRGGKCAVCK
jgi:hypothetical protein